MHIRFFTYKGFGQFLTAADLTPVRFCWDFGSLADYHNPDMWFEPQLQMRARLPLSTCAKFGLYALRPVWQVLNIVFPRRLQSAIVSLCPGLPCAGFYARCRKPVQGQSGGESK
jgi:hypothetical protein